MTILMRLPIRNGVMSYREHSGMKGVVLFVHGLGADGSSFDASLDLPSLEGLHLLAPDLLGFGQSDKPLAFDYSLDSFTTSLEEFLDRLAIGPFHLVGHSMGGSIAILLAQRRPQQVQTLIVAEPNLVASDATLSKQISSQSEADFALSFPVLLEKIASGTKESGRPGDLLFAECLRSSTYYSLYRSAKSLVEVTSQPRFLTDFLLLPMPKHYVSGELSPLGQAPPAQLHDHGVPVHVVKGADHGMMVDNPREFGEIIAACIGFLRQKESV